MPRFKFTLAFNIFKILFLIVAHRSHSVLFRAYFQQKCNINFVRSSTNTLVTAPISLPFWNNKIPDTNVSIYDQKQSKMIVLIEFEHHTAAYIVRKQVRVFAVRCKHIIMVGNINFTTDFLCRNQCFFNIHIT